MGLTSRRRITIGSTVAPRWIRRNVRRGVISSPSLGNTDRGAHRCARTSISGGEAGGGGAERGGAGGRNRAGSGAGVVAEADQLRVRHHGDVEQAERDARAGEDLAAVAEQRRADQDVELVDEATFSVTFKSVRSSWKVFFTTF